MIEIYKTGNENFNLNGDAVIHPESCILDTEDWKLTIENPPDENAKLFKSEAVVAVPTWYSDKQLFRIYDYDSTDTGVTAYARPIFFDSAHDVMLIDTRPTDKTGQQALDILTSGTRYSCESDIKDINTAYYIRKNLIEAILGDDDNSFLNRWGGQPIFDNYTMIINKRAGGDYGAQAKLAYNLESIKEHINMENVATRIVPIGYNGYTLDGPNPWIDSPRIRDYQIVYTKEIRYEDVKMKEDAGEDEIAYDTLEEYQAALIEHAKADFAGGIDLPQIEYEIEVADLAKTIEYENIKDLVTIGYGDTVECENQHLGIKTTAKVVNLTWDCILQRIETIFLGDANISYFDQLSSTMQSVNKAIMPDGTVRGEKVGGVIDTFKAKLHGVSYNAKKQSDRAILFEERDPKSPMFGALAIGTTGFLIAGERTPDDRDWNWSTFGTGKGFYADFLIAGVLLSQNWIDGKQGFKLDLNTGLFETAKATFKSLDAQGKSNRWVFEDGHFALYDFNGKKSGEIRSVTDAQGNSFLQVKSGNSSIGVFPSGYIQLMGDNMMFDATGGKLVISGNMDLTGKIVVNGKEGKSGRADFSDGSYLVFNGGLQTGGRTADGTVF